MTDENNQDSAGKGRTYKTGGGRAYSRTVEILPHPDVLESYNYVVEGSAEMILAMFDYEQQHRHEMEMQSLRLHSFATTLGQILGFFVAMAAFASATLMGIYGSQTLAAVIWGLAAVVVVMTGLSWSYMRSVGQNPRAQESTRKSEADDNSAS